MPDFKTNRGFKMKGSPMKRNFGIGVSPAKQEKKPVGPVEPKKDEERKIKKREKVNWIQEYLKGGQKELTGKAAMEYGTGGPNPEQKETTRLREEYIKNQ